MKRISAWAITHPVFPLVLFAILIFFGVVAFVRLPVNNNPNVDAAFVQVSVSQPGAAPSEIETQLLQKLEASIASVGNVKHITSVALEGLAFITVEFQVGTPVDRATNDVRDAVAKTRGQLPEGIQEPVVQRLDVVGGPLAYIAASNSQLSEEQLSWFVDDTLTKRLLAITGVSRVTRSGGVSREIRVDLDPARMQSFGITAAELNVELRQLNLDAAGGRAQLGGGEQAIRVLGGARTAAELGDLEITLGGGRHARLRDIAEVRDSVAEVRSISRLNGRPATSFAVFRATGASEVDTMERVNQALEKLKTEQPNLQLEKIFSLVDFAAESYHSSIKALIEGALFAVLIVWVFLRDWRATAIAALAIPLSALPTFAFMQLAGFTLNQMTLLALSLVTGVLVDDAIVEIENISRHMATGKSPYRAAMEAADEIGLAVVATSMTIIAVFVPVAFMGGLIGQYFREFGLTVAMAVFMSLLVARLITPLVSAYLLKPNPKLRAADGPLMTNYLNMLRWTVAHRGKTLLLGTGVFALSIAGLVLIPKTFIDAQDQSLATVKIEFVPGVLLSQTAAASAAAYQILKQSPEVQNVMESIGEDEDGEVRFASLYVALVKPEQRQRSQQQWQDDMLGKLRGIPDARISFASQNDGGGRDLTLFVVGSNPALAEKAARDIVEGMRTLPVLRDPRINGDLRRPEMIIKPRLDLAAQLGVTVANISQTVRVATLGDISQNKAQFSLADRQIPIRVSLNESARRDLGVIENLPVRTASGATVPLKAVAEISFGQGPSKVRRFDQQRRISVEADLNNAQLGTALDRIHALPAVKNLPDGVQLIQIGSAEYMQELFKSFLIALAAGILMVFAVLVLLFARVFQPITILSALPLSIGGAILALVVTGNPFSLSTVIGMLMLMGIVAKNSILLVDFAIEEMRAGKDRLTALVEAGHKRARPIVMTTVAMIAGMLPVAFGIGGTDSFQGAMAVAVIGGLITSTALTLVMVPAAFCWIDGLERRAAQLVAGHVNEKHVNEKPIGALTPEA
jgi:hydrophobe/amphiphile efflux-1 (HAE1) family protein